MGRHRVVRDEVASHDGRPRSAKLGDPDPLVSALKTEFPKRGIKPSITCPRCRWTSYNPNDVEQRYCGHCHMFHEDM